MSWRCRWLQQRRQWRRRWRVGGRGRQLCGGSLRRRRSRRRRMGRKGLRWRLKLRRRIGRHGVVVEAGCSEACRRWFGGRRWRTTRLGVSCRSAVDALLLQSPREFAVPLLTFAVAPVLVLAPPAASSLRRGRTSWHAQQLRRDGGLQEGGGGVGEGGGGWRRWRCRGHFRLLGFLTEVLRWFVGGRCGRRSRGGRWRARGRRWRLRGGDYNRQLGYFGGLGGLSLFNGRAAQRLLDGSQ